MIYGLAAAEPRTAAELEAGAALPPAVARKRGEELLTLISAAAGSAGPGSVESSGRRPTPAENALVAKLQKVVREEAAALDLSPEVLCTRRDVEALVFPTAASQQCCAAGAAPRSAKNCWPRNRGHSPFSEGTFSNFDLIRRSELD